MRLRLEPTTHLSQRWVRKPRFVDTARQAIEAEMSTKVRSMKEAQRGVADAQSLMRIGEGSLNATEPDCHTHPRARDSRCQCGSYARSARSDCWRDGCTATRIRAHRQHHFNRLKYARGWRNLDVLADDTGSVIAQTSSYRAYRGQSSGVDTAPPAAAISFASSALSATLSARAQLGTYDNIYARADANLAQSMENHVQALTA